MFRANRSTAGKAWAIGGLLALIAALTLTMGVAGVEDASAQTSPQPVTCWHFENGFASSTDGFDGFAGAQAAGAGTNDAATTTTNPSPAGGASLTLDGDGDYLQVGNPLPTAGSYSKTMWIYRANTNVDGSWENLYTSGDAGGAHALAIDPSQNDNLLVWHRGGSGPGLEAHDTGYAAPTGQWIHVAAVYDEAADTLTTYANGMAVNMQTPVGTLGEMVEEDTIGSYAAMQSWFNGQMDDVCIYDSALAANQVAALASPTSGQVCTFTGMGGTIPDGSSFDGLRSTIEISHQAIIQDIELALVDIQHANIGELTMIMNSPDSNLFVSVMNEAANGDDSDLNGTYVISDSGASLFDAANAAGPDEVIPPGSYRASRSDTDAEAFAEQFVGMSTAGTWSLDMFDNVAGNVGAVASVELRITVSSGGCPATGAATTCLGLAVTIDMNTNGGNGVGTDGDDVILGTPGADVIDAGTGNDTVCAGDGNDNVEAGPGDDVVLGEGGNDKLFGRQGADDINGGDGDDVIHGNKGNDTLAGEAGADRIFGYANNDTITGGDGNDRLHGNFGDDVIDGGDGDDRIFGYGDQDTLSGGIGDDLISGNFGDDIINGDAGDDILFGADGDDTVNGGAGNDQVNGNSLNDTLSGGAGDDTLDGGINNDTCHGNAGTDTATRCETVVEVP